MKCGSDQTFASTRDAFSRLKRECKIGPTILCVRQQLRQSVRRSLVAARRESEGRDDRQPRDTEDFHPHSVILVLGRHKPRLFVGQGLQGLWSACLRGTARNVGPANRQQNARLRIRLRGAADGDLARLA